MDQHFHEMAVQCSVRISGYIKGAAGLDAATDNTWCQHQSLLQTDHLQATHYLLDPLKAKYYKLHPWHTKLLSNCLAHIPSLKYFSFYLKHHFFI